MSSPRRILLVEDDREQAALFAQVLSMSWYNVVTVATAEAALEQLATSPFDLLLSDWDLPEMKGDALIAVVKTQYPAMRTVLFSNHTTVDQACAICGADAWFRKIEGIVKLREIINALLPRNAGHA